MASLPIYRCPDCQTAARELVAGNGFLAGVSACGRVLVSHEDSGEWWLNGVEPAGIAEGGTSPQEAHLQFFTGLRHILYDIAARTASFDEFAAAVKNFFREVDEEDEAVWRAGLQELRAGAAVEDPYVASLERRPFHETPCKVEVLRLDAEESHALNSGLNPETVFTVPGLPVAA